MRCGGGGDRTSVCWRKTELAELQAEHTERGLVITPSDEILFDVDEAELKSGGMQRLVRGPNSCAIISIAMC